MHFPDIIPSYPCPFQDCIPTVDPMSSTCPLVRDLFIYLFHHQHTRHTPHTRNNATQTTRTQCHALHPHQHLHFSTNTRKPRKHRYPNLLKGTPHRTRLTIKHANIIRCNKYGAARLQVFVRKPRDALESILKTASNEKKTRHHTAPTNLSSIRDPITRRIASDPT